MDEVSCRVILFLMLSVQSACPLQTEQNSGQSLTVSGLPGEPDLALFKDPGRAMTEEVLCFYTFS